ncbi:MAG: hypothetical protein IKF14_14435 [Atopobiaceae bacterium]|nr:hypothetical protein [Atopobiaceae bacterium]
MSEASREIGGYFEIEKPSGHEYHRAALALNSGRNCLRYLIRARGIRSILLPEWICDSVSDTCMEEGVRIQRYSISSNLRPVLPEHIEEDAYVYVVNYFGQLSECEIKQLSERTPHVVLDNAQAFFVRPSADIDTLYTCRKYFGVSDGGYLYTNARLTSAIEMDESRERLLYMYGRLEVNASSFFGLYHKNEDAIASLPIRAMSKTTHVILQGIDYENVCKRREKNYQVLHQALMHLNAIEDVVPKGAFMYPLLVSNGEAIRRELIKRKIYIPLLWPNVVEDETVSEQVRSLALNLLPVPCDQRYDEKDMNWIIENISALV